MVHRSAELDHRKVPRLTHLPDIISVQDASTPLVRVVFNFLGGSSLEPEGYEGMACLANRLMLRGTQLRTRDQFENTIEQLGVNLIPSCGVGSLSIGGSLLRRHQTTWFNLVQEALTLPGLRQDEIDRTKREMLAENDCIFDEDAQLGRLMLRRHLYADSRYGHSTLGTAASMARIQLKDIQEFVSQTYTKSRLVLGCAGDIGDAFFDEQCQQIIQSLPKGEAIQYPNAPPKHTRRKMVIVHKPSRSQCQLFTGQLIPGCNDTVLLPYQVGALVFGGTFSSRLVQRMRVDRGLCYGAHAWLSAERTCGGFFTHTDVDAERVDEAVLLLNELLDEFTANGPTPEEFAFARSAILKGMPFGLETASMESAQRVRLRLLGKDPSDLDRKKEMLDSLTLTEVQHAVSGLPNHGARVMVVVCSFEGETERKLTPILEHFDVTHVGWN